MTERNNAGNRKRFTGPMLTYLQVKTSEHVLDLGGDSRDAIVDFSKELKPALLVVGSRGHGAVKRCVPKLACC